MTESPVQLRLLDFVQCVLERPRMYTERGSYYEVIALLKGYLSNLPGQHFGRAPWFEFLDWLPEHVPEGEGRLLVRFREGFEDDSTAIRALYVLYSAGRPSGK